MKSLAERLAGLINVKTIVTFAITFVFSALALKGEIPPDTAMTVVVMVLGFYFGVQHERKNGGE
jgi:hypothetical protein